MSDSIPNPVKGMKPKTLAIIAVGGIAVGLVVRYMRKGESAVAVEGEPLEVVGTESDITLPLSASSSGNLSTSDMNVVPDGRDTGSISLPVVKWAVVIDGVEFLTDGTSLWSTRVGEVTTGSGTVIGRQPRPLPRPNPAPKPTPTPTQSKTVVIKRGDTLISLVRSAYPALRGAAFNSKVKSVAASNGLTWYDNNTKVKPFNIGQTLKL